MSEFKAFEVNEYHTVAARSLEEALAWYKENGGGEEIDADVWEVSPASLTWDYVDPFTSNTREYTELKSKVYDLMREECESEVRIDGRFHTIICGDLFRETTYSELLKRVTEPMILTTTEW